MGKGGGGSSGQVAYPDYMQKFHSDLINAGDGATGTDITNSVVSLVDAAILNNPYTDETSYNPSTPISDMNTGVGNFSTYITNMDAEGKWLSAMDTATGQIDSKIINLTAIDEATKAFSDTLADVRNNTVLPRFRGGMRDINAVTSSAFAIGEAYIEASDQREVAKFEKDLFVKMSLQRNDMIVKSAENMLSFNLAKGELQKALAHLTAETGRIKIVALKEQDDQQIVIDDKEARWDLDVTMYAGNMLAAISGAAASKELDSINPIRSAIGGAMSGAAAGAMMSGGNPIGAAIGGVGGLLMGLI